jgi:hypothetical protein
LYALHNDCPFETLCLILKTEPIPILNIYIFYPKLMEKSRTI